MTAITANDFNIERIFPLLQAILRKEPDRIIWNTLYDAVTESTSPPRPQRHQRWELTQRRPRYLHRIHHAAGLGEAQRRRNVVYIVYSCGVL
jgi:hypothetical protein